MKKLEELKKEKLLKIKTKGLALIYQKIHLIQMII